MINDSGARELLGRVGERLELQDSTIRLPPDDDSLNLHLKRTNYIAYCQLHYGMREHPSPIGHGCTIMNGKCRPVRHTVPSLPEHLAHRHSLDESNESSSDDESAFA